VKGTPNKVTTDLRQAIINALDRAGGEEWFLRLARKDKRSFTSLVGKLLPTQVTGKDGGPLELEMIAKAQGGLSNLSEADLKKLQDILTKIGLGVTP
jgi:hypothetical protein